MVRMEDSDSDRTSMCEDETFDMSQIEEETNERHRREEEEGDVDDDDDDDDESQSAGDDEGEASSSSSGTSKTPKAMTARQRALIEGKRRRHQEEAAKRKRYMETVPLTEEEILKAKRLAIRRRELARAKDEKEKQETINRLLKLKTGNEANVAGGQRRTSTGSPLVTTTGGTESAGGSESTSSDEDRLPMVRFCSTADGNSFSFPPGFEFPLRAAKAAILPAARFCVRPDCGRPRKYSGRHTGHDVCSLQCYLDDLHAWRAAP